MKRTLAFCLSLLLIVMMIPLGTFAASAAASGTTGDCTWTLDDAGNLTISGNGKMGGLHFHRQQCALGQIHHLRHHPGRCDLDRRI